MGKDGETSYGSRKKPDERKKGVSVEHQETKGWLIGLGPEHFLCSRKRCNWRTIGRDLPMKSGGKRSTGACERNRRSNRSFLPD